MPLESLVLVSIISRPCSNEAKAGRRWSPTICRVRPAPFPRSRRCSAAHTMRRRGHARKVPSSSFNIQMSPSWSAAMAGIFAPHPRFVNIERFKISAGITRQVAAFMADPQDSFRVLKQTRHPVALQSRCAGAVKNGEADPVEPHQAAVGAGPEIAIARLHHRRHRICPAGRFPSSTGTRKIIRQFWLCRARRKAVGKRKQQRENSRRTIAPKPCRTQKNAPWRISKLAARWTHQGILLGKKIRASQTPFPPSIFATRHAFRSAAGRAR